MDFARNVALFAGLVVAAAGCKKKDDGPQPPPATVQPVGARAAGADDLELPVIPPKVGDKQAEVEDLMTTMQVEITPGKTVELVNQKHQEEVREVLAVDGDMITEIKVAYNARTEQQSMAGQPEDDEVSPLAGKTYLVWRVGDKLQATREDGSVPEGEELTDVLKGNRKIGRPDVEYKLVASRRWRTGVPVEFTAAELTQLNAARDPDAEEPTVTSMRLTLRSTDATTATFALQTSMTVQDSRGSMEVALAGTVVIDRATGRKTLTDLTGQLKGNLGTPMTGTTRGKSTYTY